MGLSFLWGVLNSPGGAKLWRLGGEEEKVGKQYMRVWGRNGIVQGQGNPCEFPTEGVREGEAPTSILLRSQEGTVLIAESICSALSTAGCSTHLGSWAICLKYVREQ